MLQKEVYVLRQLPLRAIITGLVVYNFIKVTLSYICLPALSESYYASTASMSGSVK